jgi:hypothetical protein
MSGPIISSFCSGADCVQVERIGDVIAVTATADRMRRELLFSRTEWAAFLTAVKGGEYDLPEAQA